VRCRYLRITCPYALRLTLVGPFIAIRTSKRRTTCPIRPGRLRFPWYRLIERANAAASLAYSPVSGRRGEGRRPVVFVRLFCLRFAIGISRRPKEWRRRSTAAATSAMDVMPIKSPRPGALSHALNAARPRATLASIANHKGVTHDLGDACLPTPSSPPEQNTVVAPEMPGCVASTFMWKRNLF
jgi:hypothetical protein